MHRVFRASRQKVSRISISIPLFRDLLASPFSSRSDRRIARTGKTGGRLQQRGRLVAWNGWRLADGCTLHIWKPTPRHTGAQPMRALDTVLRRSREEEAGAAVVTSGAFSVHR